LAHVTVNEMLKNQFLDLGLTVVAGEQGLANQIKVPYVQKPGLAMTGYVSFVAKNRVQVFGKTEISYVAQLSTADQETILQKYFDQQVACCIVTRSLEIPPAFIQHAERTNTPVLVTGLNTQPLIERLTKFLEAHFAKTTSIHGVLMDVFGVGVLLLGDSGIGKSECALDLILRGHRLVADDMVDLIRQGPFALHGRGPEVTKYHMEIRGLGIINIKELFGISAIRDRKKVQIIIKLVGWDKDTEYDRLGLEDSTYSLLGVDLPLIVLPVRSGRNLSTIIEVAARNYLLKLEGFHAAKEFQDRLIRKLAEEAELITEEPE